MSQSDYTSNSVNTDSSGFRISGYDNVGVDSLIKDEPVDIFTGGSAAFGVGATSDKTTIPALLSGDLKNRWINFSNSAYTSTQEFISFMYYRSTIHSVENIVIFSGINDLYLYFASKYFNENMGAFFYASDYFYKMIGDCRFRTVLGRPVVNNFLRILYGEHDFELLSNKDSFDLLVHKQSISQIEEIIAQYNVINSHKKYPTEVINVLRRNLSNWKIVASYFNARLIYVLQPFSNWLPNRKLTFNEKVVFDILDKEGGKNWKLLSKDIDELHEWYSGEINRACKEQEVCFWDSHEAFMGVTTTEDVFVDRVHLTDFGNQMISEYIKEKLWS